MHPSRAAVCVLVLFAGSTLALNPAMSTLASQDSPTRNVANMKGTKCPSAASATDNCATPDQDSGLPDLTPTQWLFGKLQDKKLAAPSTHSMLMARARMATLSTMPAAPTAVSPEYAALLHLLVLPAAPGTAVRAARQLTPAEEKAMQDQAGRYLVEEWRAAEIAVADSVHHDVLVRIGKTYDSLEVAGVSRQDRTDGLSRLDQLAETNQYSWVLFRYQINLRADSAIAAGAQIAAAPR